MLQTNQIEEINTRKGLETVKLTIKIIFESK